MKIKLYKVNFYQAYRADEEGVRWLTSVPTDDVYYKSEIIEETEKELPSGITYDEKFNQFCDNGQDCTLVNENDGTVWLVSADRMVKWF